MNINRTKEFEKNLELWEKQLKGKNKSGFFDLKNHCTDVGHNFPSHVHIPTGKGYMHVCPSCGEKTIAINAISICVSS